MLKCQWVRNGRPTGTFSFFRRCVLLTQSAAQRDLKKIGKYLYGFIKVPFLNALDIVEKDLLEKGFSSFNTNKGSLCDGVGRVVREWECHLCFTLRLL